MPQEQRFFPLRGGLDQETPAIGIPPGRVIQCQNHEAEPNGYRRTEGFERFDGRAAPSDADFSTLTFRNSVLAFLAGDIITGAISGATARVLGSIPPASPELIVNGTFDTDTTGWTGISAFGGLAVITGRLRLTKKTVAATAYQAFNTVIGQSYTVSANLTHGTSSQQRFVLGTTAGGSDISSSSIVGSQLLTFVATTAVTYVSLLIPGGSTDGYAELDNVSVKLGDSILAVHLITGTFIASENLLVSGVLYATLITVPELGDSLQDAQRLQWLVDAQTYLRGLIQAPAGSGPVRGVLYYGGHLNAWRDNAGVTAGILFHSTLAGWVATDLGKTIKFTTGGPYEPMPGDAITGDQSGATATIRYVAVDSGDWSTSDAAGVFVLDNVVGTLGDETITHGLQAAFAHLIATPLATAFPPGGRYEFSIFNYFATASFERAYCANDVSQAFEFDGSSVAFISTGSDDDTPYLVNEHKEQLFLAFHSGSLQSSIVGLPRNFSGRLGAAELGLGHEITNIIANTANVMLIFTDQSMSALTGNDSSDFSLSPQGEEDAGAKAWTAQRIGQVIYLDNRGVRSASSTQLYGNFRLGTFTSLIAKELDRKNRAGITPVASCVVKTKSQYLLFFSDGSGISIFFGLKQPEAMLFEYPFVVSCTPHVVEIDGEERVFVGAEDGFVYELNKGTSFDGDVIEAFIQLPYSHQGDPRLVKRYQKLELEMTAAPQTVLGLIPQFDSGNPEQPFAVEQDLTIQGGGGLWGVAVWGEFIWGAPDSGRVEFDMEGVGSNMSGLFVSRQSTISSYTLSGVTVVFRGRGRRR